MWCSRCGRPRTSCSCMENQQRCPQQGAASFRQVQQSTGGISNPNAQDVHGSLASWFASGPTDTQGTALALFPPLRAHSASAGHQMSSPASSRGSAPARAPPVDSARRQTSGPTISHGATLLHTHSTQAIPIRSVRQRTSDSTTRHNSDPSYSPVNTSPPVAPRADRSSQTAHAGPAGQRVPDIDELKFSVQQELDISRRGDPRSTSNMAGLLTSFVIDHNNRMPRGHPRMEIFGSSQVCQGSNWLVTGSCVDEEGREIRTASVKGKSIPFNQGCIFF